MKDFEGCWSISYRKVEFPQWEQCTLLCPRPLVFAIDRSEIGNSIEEGPAGICVYMWLEESLNQRKI